MNERKVTHYTELENPVWREPGSHRELFVELAKNIMYAEVWWTSLSRRRPDWWKSLFTKVCEEKK
jgi:hypothetical protein